MFRTVSLFGGFSQSERDMFAGIFFVLPCIESYQKVDLRTITMGVPPQEVMMIVCMMTMVMMMVTIVMMMVIVMTMAMIVMITNDFNGCPSSRGWNWKHESLLEVETFF